MKKHFEPYNARLVKDVKSYLKKGDGFYYGRRLDNVLIVAEFGNVLIAKNAGGIRFAVQKKKVMELL